MLLKLIYIISCLTGIYMQRPSCRQIDFNYIESIIELEPCEDGGMFDIKSYADVSFESNRNVENHLSNVENGISCFRTVQIFNLDNYSEIDLLIYLNSLNSDDELFVDIQAFDTVEGIFYSVGAVTTVSNEWNAFHVLPALVIANAQFEIRANTTVDTQLAIEYLYIINPRKAEPYCRIPEITTTELPTTVPTVPETDSTEPESDTTVAESDTTVTEIDTTVTESDTTVTESDATVTESDTTVTETDTTVTETDTTVTESDTTVTESDTTVTETDTTATEDQPTQIPTDPINSNVWTVLSFTFILTTIIASGTLIYVVYLYKSAAIMSKSLMMAPNTKSSIPRVTLANGRGGDHIIVGVENGYNSSVMKSKYF